MLNVNAMPCATCVYYNGIKQSDGTEKTEYIACKKAKDGKADELLHVDGRSVKCNYWKEDD